MTTYNPWNVDSIQDFSFLKCPECPFDAKAEDIFQNHAIENHPLSFVLFGGEPLKVRYHSRFFVQVGLGMKPLIHLHSGNCIMSSSDGQTTKIIKVANKNRAYF